MIDKIKILDVIRTSLEGSDKFLVDLKVSTDNRINVAIDSDSVVTIDDCVELSRQIEGSLDRDEEDFELNVASAGLDSPLKLQRQYIKNIGRDLHVTPFEGSEVEGTLVEADGDHIVIETPKTKKSAAMRHTFAYKDIQTAKIVIKF